ncbi:MAG TPA: ArsR family transcriptional regulator [Terriglobia bacterium]
MAVTPILPVLAGSGFTAQSSLGTRASMLVAEHRHFVYDRSMNAEPDGNLAVSRIAAAIAEPARVRILYGLVDGHARTSTELAVIAEVSPSTASVHLNRLKTERLIKVWPQGKHRYYSLQGTEVARALEALSVLAGGSPDRFVPNTPSYLRAARSCYDHIAGTLGVLLHDRLKALGWLSASSTGRDDAYELTRDGAHALEALGIDVAATRMLRRRLAFPCMDWSERRSHLGGAIGAALLKLALKRKWVIQDLDSRALFVTGLGRRELLTRFGLHL